MKYRRLFILLLSVTLLLSGCKSPLGTDPAAGGDVTDPTEEAKLPGRVLMSAVNKVQVGMTQDEVAEILGEPGVSSSAIGLILMYRTKDNVYITIVFDDGTPPRVTQVMIGDGVQAPIGDGRVSMEDVLAVQEGMSILDVCMIFGAKGADIGSGTVVLEYYTHEGVQVQIGFIMNASNMFVVLSITIGEG